MRALDGDGPRVLLRAVLDGLALLGLALVAVEGCSAETAAVFFLFCAVGEVGATGSADPSSRPNIGDEGVSLVHHGNVRAVLCTWCTILDGIPLRLLRVCRCREC